MNNLTYSGSALDKFADKIDFTKLVGKPEDFYKAGISFVEDRQFDEGIIEFVKIIKTVSYQDPLFNEAERELKSMGFSIADIRAIAGNLEIEIPEEYGEIIDEPHPDVNWLLTKTGSNAIVSLIVTTVAAVFFELGCNNLSYLGNLPIIFILTWLTRIGLVSLFGGEGTSVSLGGIFLSLIIILLGAFPCIAMIGFWIAPVCN